MTQSCGRLQKIITGLQIFAKYNSDAEIHGAHDEIYIGGPEPSTMDPVDVKTLEECGFHFESKYDGWHRFV